MSVDFSPNLSWDPPDRFEVHPQALGTISTIESHIPRFVFCSVRVYMFLWGGGGDRVYIF